MVIYIHKHIQDDKLYANHTISLVLGKKQSLFGMYLLFADVVVELSEY